MEPMYELVLFATLAVIVCVVLYSVLGRQIGRGPDEDQGPDDIFGTTRDMDDRPPAPGRPARSVIEPKPSPDEVVGENIVAMAAAGESGAAEEPKGLSDIRRLDADFDTRVFRDQATTAYAMVLEAFAASDRDTLAMLLTPRMNDIYGEAIDDRERQNLTQVTDVLSVGGAQIVEARVNKSVAEIDVRFSSELSSALVDSVGQPVLGDPDLIAKTTEVWTFVRDLRSEDPAWRLSDVAPETGDALPADPAPDTTT